VSFFNKKSMIALGLVALNLATAKNFDISQPKLLGSYLIDQPLNVSFNTYNGQTLGYCAGGDTFGLITVFTPPFSIQGTIAIDSGARGMLFNNVNSDTFAYVACVQNNQPIDIVQLYGTSGALQGSISVNPNTPEFAVKKTVAGSDYGYWVGYKGGSDNGSVLSFDLLGTNTQLAGSISVGLQPYYITFNPENDNYAYVPNTGDSSLSILTLNGTAFVSSATISLGGTPQDICVVQFPEGVTGYVTNSVSGLNILAVEGPNVSLQSTFSDSGPLLSIASTVLNDVNYAYAFSGDQLQIYELNQGTCTLLNSLDTPSSQTSVSKMSFNSVGQNTYGYLPLTNPVNLLQVYLLNQNPFPTFSGNAGIVSSLLNEINNDGCLVSTQDLIEFLFLQENPPLESYINQLAPAFKIAQYSLEKLDLVLHKQLDSKLYQNDMNNDLFVLAGYDHLSQKGTRVYNRYNVDNYFQMLGGSYHFSSLKTMGVIGASESYIKVHPQDASAKYPTVWAALGLMGQIKNWTLGIDGLFGYSFLQTSRKIDFLNQKAHSNHNAWNVSVEGKVSYTKEDENILFRPYDTFGYLYGHEANYRENGASGANLKVKGENLSVFRNALGLEFDAPKDTYVQAIFDLAWVYEYYFTSTSFKAAFVGTDAYGTFKQVQPTRNYGRANIGLCGNHNHFEWKLVYTGLYGKRFSENTGTLELGYKF